MSFLNSNTLGVLTSATKTPVNPSNNIPITPGGDTTVPTTTTAVDISSVAAMNNPIEIPATSASVADTMYLLNVLVKGNNISDSTQLFLSYAPVISSTGEVLLDQTQQYQNYDVYGDIANGNTDLQSVIASIYQMIQNLNPVSSSVQPEQTPTSGSSGG